MTFFEIIMSCVATSTLGHCYWRYTLEEQESLERLAKRQSKPSLF